MTHDLTFIATFIRDAFIHMLPYLLVSIPFAVAVRVSKMEQHIKRIFTGNPIHMILLATVIGAFSPLCSCSVIPVIASLLIAGVPLAPVMAFWIASPSMDPEIFFLSVGMLGWQLAVARVVATLILSFGGGLVTHYLMQRDFFADGIMREKQGSTDVSWVGAIRDGLAYVRRQLQPQPIVATDAMFISIGSIGMMPASGGSVETISRQPKAKAEASCGCGDTTAVVEDSCATGACAVPVAEENTFWADARRETLSVTWMIVQFMFIAYLLEALIVLYVPQESIVKVLGESNPFAIVLATLIGIPVYTTNLAALPLVSGLLEQGAVPGAALAFMIAGPTTTLPAMAAVFGIAKKRVFFVYLGIALVGSLVLGYGYQVLVVLS